MGKKLWVTMSAAGALATVLAFTALGAGASPDASRDSAGAWGRGYVDVGRGAAAMPASHEGGQTIVVGTREVNAKDINVDGPSYGPGDYSVFREELFRSGRHVGHDNVICMANFPFTRQRAAFRCEGTFTFYGRGGIERGQVESAGQIVFTANESSSQFIAITGGTRHYQNVRGQLEVPARGNRLILHLLP
jgi:hypothetical protein